MSLGKKTLALFLVLGCAICLGSYLALRLTVLPTFDEFEEKASDRLSTSSRKRPLRRLWRASPAYLSRSFVHSRS
jgi:hypothetical protein